MRNRGELASDLPPNFFPYIILWIKAQNVKPMGQDWQTWSAALFLYATRCVEENGTPFFNEIRNAD